MGDTLTGRRPVIALLGGIGAGKSLAAAAFARRGGTLIDADKIGHESLETPEVKRQLVEHWGSTVLKPEGSANRRAIADIVFRNPPERRFLESVLFPTIGRRTEEQIAKAEGRFVVLDAAVMLEAGWERVADRIVFVDAPRELRLARVAARSGWTEDDLTARESAQWSLEAKRAKADVVLVNDGTPEQLQERVDELLARWGY